MYSNLHLGNKSLWFRPLWISLILAYVFLPIPYARAQQNQIDALAARIAEEINKKHEKTVIVFDFVGPNKKSTALGQKVADDFSDALKKSSAAFSVFDWSQITPGLEASRLSSHVLYDAETKLWLAKKLGQGLMVLGTLDLDGETLNITMDSYGVKDGVALKEFKVEVPLTEQMKSLIETLPDAGKEQSETLPRAGLDGYSAPVCTRCPFAPFSSLAITNHTEGTVLLVVVVGTDGRAHDIFVVKALPDGLTESAIKAVRSWKFKPATGPDGTVAAVRQTIEVIFHLYKQ